MRYVLGVDGGGTKCDAVLMDDTGVVVGWGRGGSTHGLYVGSEAATNSVKTAVRGATAQASADIARIAGCVPYANFNEWLERPPDADAFVPAGEPALGFATAMATRGILVLSGTGSFVYGLTADGRSRHEGGHGPIIADEGSAHHIGILGVRAAFSARYSARRRTSLAKAVPRGMGVEKLHDVFRLLYVDNIGRSGIAAVAKTVNQEAEAGDEVARGVLMRAATELGELLVEVIQELEMQDSDDLMVATGSVAQGSRIFWQTLCDIALAVAPNLRPVQPRIRPVVGACLIALRDIGVKWDDALMQRIVDTQQPFLDRLEITPQP